MIKRFVFLLLLLAFLPSCKKGRDLRGLSTPSTDGGTYLIVADDNGGNCQLMLDGKRWTHRKGEAGSVSAGRHTLSSCDSHLVFEVSKGNVYTFDYWGP